MIGQAKIFGGGVPIGSWFYSVSPDPSPQYVVQEDLNPVGLTTYVYADVNLGTASSTQVDSFGRQYKEVGGYRYTGSKTAVLVSPGAFNNYKICRTVAGIVPIGETT